MGTLVRQLWSVAGPSDRPNVSQLLLQPFFNYNMAEGWYLVSSPIITANWKATSGSKWAFPIGRRHRQDFQDRRSAYECFAAGLRLRGVANWWTAMGRLRPIAIPFSALTARPDRPSPFRSDVDSASWSTDMKPNPCSFARRWIGAVAALSVVTSVSAF